MGVEFAHHTFSVRLWSFFPLHQAHSRSPKPGESRGHHGSAPHSKPAHTAGSDAPQRKHLGASTAHTGGIILSSVGSTQAGDHAATTFKALRLAPPLLASLHEEGYDTPTPIQAQAIPPIMQGRDVLGCAQTGTGKTAAFAVPILHRLLEQGPDKSRKGPALPRVCVLSPTRELATQIGDSFATYGRHAGLTHTVIFGGVSQFHQVKALHKGVDILVATPGRLIDLMEQRLVTLSHVNIFVLDEADRMLDMGFIKPIQRIASAIPKSVASRLRQTLLFSATMPREIQHLAESLLTDPVRISVAPVSSAAPLIEQTLYYVHRLHKQALLTHLLETMNAQRAVVFTKTKHGADKVQKRLKAAGISAEAIHGNKAQNYRTRALEAFRSGRSRVLVATDVAARGLDVDNVTHVFNFDLPMEPEAYVHRIGRTGRMGNTGLAIAFCDNDERDLLRQVEKTMGKKIPVKPTPQVPDLPPVEELEALVEQRRQQFEHNARRPQHRDGRASHRGEPAPSARPPRDERGARGTRASRDQHHATDAAPQRRSRAWEADQAGHRPQGAGAGHAASRGAPAQPAWKGKQSPTGRANAGPSGAISARPQDRAQPKHGPSAQPDARSSTSPHASKPGQHHPLQGRPSQGTGNAKHPKPPRAPGGKPSNAKRRERW